MSEFLLIHSPVVGPATWAWVASELQAHGKVAVVPDLVDAAATGDPHAFAQAAASATVSGDEVVVVGHSGAGSMLPAVAELIPDTRMLVFVDASVPPCEGSFNAGGDFLETLRQIAINGVLPIWSQWFGADVMQTLVPSDERRARIEHELPRVPLAFFEAPITVPRGWCARSCAFVQLSDGYGSEARTARSRGWPVVERLGEHLDIANNETVIAGILERFG